MDGETRRKVVQRAARRIVPFAVVGAAVVAGIAGLVALSLHARLFAARLTFPLDLEWMEGGMLVHAQRLAAGRQIYVAPTLEFIPFLYTPFYPALVALLSFVAPLGYTLGRALSVLAFAGALAVVVALAAREGWRGSRLAAAAALATGLAAAGAVAASFEFTAGFYDLVRSDSLLLACEAAAVALAIIGTGWRSAALAGVAIALAFFTKQTAAIVGIALGLGLLAARWRHGLVYGAAAAAVLGLGILLLAKTSDGWFWRYIFEGHQSHEFRWGAALHHAPKVLWQHEGFVLVALVLATAGLALARQLRRTDIILWAMALGGLVAACVGFGTQWASENAYIPGVYFPMLAAAALGARLLVHAAGTARVGSVVSSLLLPAALAMHDARLASPNLARWAPTRTDRQAAARFLERLRPLQGDGFIPFHPYYASLVGKKPFVHRMGIWDVAAKYGRPAGLDEALAQRKFGFIVLDWKWVPYEFPYVDNLYKLAHVFRDGVDAARSFAGAETSPRYLLVPNEDPPPLPQGAQRLVDFESNRWDTWSADAAFGSTPAWAPAGFYGRHAAESAAMGPAGQGALRSPRFTLDKPRLRFRLGGAADPNLRVLLLAGSDTARAASPSGKAADVVWDVSDLAGREVTLVVEDRSPGASIVFDELVAF